jgi:hypothetical protein
MNTFFTSFIFAFMITLWGIPVYIIQILITKFAGVKYRFILPIVSAIICAIISMVFVFGLASFESVGELFGRFVYGVTMLILFQIPTFILLLVGHLTSKLSAPNNDVERMKHLDLE